MTGGNVMINAETLEKAKKDILEKFNIEIVKAESGKAVCELRLLEGHVNFYGIPYGGVLFNLADITAGIAYLSAGGNGITLSGHVDFMRGARNAEKLICCAEVTKSGKKFFFLSASIEDDKKETLCKFSFIFANV